MNLQPEQIYVLGVFDGKFLLSGTIHDHVPWHLLARTCVYCLSEEDMTECLIDAVTRGYMILDGASSKRKGLQGFHVAVGAWGFAGRVEVLTVDSWCLQPPRGLGVPQLVSWCEEALRETCRRLNGEETPFRSSALRWLSSLYYRIGRPNEPGGEIPPPLPADVAKMARAAHIGGPVLQVQSSIGPFVSIDRNRAYGQALLGEMPCGDPVEVDLGYRPLARWEPNALMRAMGIAEATVNVFMGPLVPLLPVMQASDEYVDRTRTLYPTGTMRGTWTLNELAHLEMSGRGEVNELHRVVVFDKGEPYQKMIWYLRRIERDLPNVRMKNLEHMIYGTCARRLHVTRFGTARADVAPMPSDLLDSRTMERLGTRVSLRRYGLPPGHKAPLPLYEVSGELSEGGAKGTIDRPDRSAWITSLNRVEMAKIIGILDTALAPSRSGAYIGRIFVDGIDIQATPDQVPSIPGASIRAHGPRMNIYRAGAFVAELADGRVEMSATGLIADGLSPDDFVKKIQMSVDADGGPLAGGRHWQAVEGVEDPRMVPGQVSQPLHLDLAVLQAVGLS